MRSLKLEETKGVFFTPKIYLKSKTGHCEIAGESYIEDADLFYQPIIDWLDTYIKKVKKPIVFDFRLTYFNTSSSKALLNILKKLRSYKQTGGQVEINWYYPEDNYDLLAEAEDYIEDLGIEMNLIPYELEY